MRNLVLTRDGAAALAVAVDIALECVRKDIRKLRPGAPAHAEAVAFERELLAVAAFLPPLLPPDAIGMPMGHA